MTGVVRKTTQSVRYSTDNKLKLPTDRGVLGFWGYVVHEVRRIFLLSRTVQRTGLLRFNRRSVIRRWEKITVAAKSESQKHVHEDRAETRICWTIWSNDQKMQARISAYVHKRTRAPRARVTRARVSVAGAPHGPVMRVCLSGWVRFRIIICICIKCFWRVDSISSLVIILFRV